MRFFIWSCSILLVTGFAYSQKSPFNHTSIELDSTGDYSFIVSGHFHGDGNNKSGMPVNTLMANMDWINQSEADFMVCLGDLFLNIEKDIPAYQSHFFDRLEMPLFNVVGNHDLEEQVYQDNFGETSFEFDLNGERHIFLDTERDDGDLKGDQLEKIKKLSRDIKKGTVETGFIYSHRTIWKDKYEELDELFVHNTQSFGEPNFEGEVYPLLEEASSKNKIYWFSGSMGGGPSSFFHFEDKNISYILSAIRGLQRDAILMVHIKKGEVSFETHSLTGQELEPLSHYDVEYWSTTEEESEFSLGLLWYQFRLAISHRYFWYGIGFAFGFIGLIWIFRRRRRKN